jgi:hypothetical protein
MSRKKITIASLRLRIPESAYDSIWNLLSEAGSRRFVAGYCGRTQTLVQQGIEAVYFVYNVNDGIFPLDETGGDELAAWQTANNVGDSSWPVVFYHSDDKADGDRIVLQHLSGRSEQILAVAIGDKGELSGIGQFSNALVPIDSIMVTGSDILFWSTTSGDIGAGDPERTRRFEQSFGSKTQRIVSSLKIGVVGASGTGSPVAEMLYRLGVGELVLVDDDRVETKNLGRIYNSALQDAKEARLKVNVLGDAFEKNGLPTRIKRVVGTTRDSGVISELAQCDIVFGCMDTESGRQVLNRLATFYLIPYFDLGVNLKADGQGGVSVVCGAVHYLKPGGSSLLSRRAISIENIEAEDLKRENPEMYRRQREEKYIRGVVEERPAVITVNTMIATLALNDFLARLHPYRRNPNAEIGCLRVDLREPAIHTEEDGSTDAGLARWVGKGDVKPLLRMPAFE